MATAKKASPKKSAKKPATKKPAAKKVAAKKAPTKKPAAKKVAAKKPAVKKPAPKKPVAKPAAKKPAVKKAPAKAAKTPTKKATPAPAAKKPAAKPAAKAPSPKKSGPSFTPPGAFTPLFTSLEQWVNGGKLGEIDFEVYQNFNEQYKPSDWFSEPALDKVMFSFAMDGTGGQFTIWQNGSSAQLEDLPVVLLGSEGSTIVLTQNVPEFFALVAAGIDPAQLEYQGISGKEKPHADFSAFVKSQWPQKSFASPKEIFSNAKKTLQVSFEAFVAEHL